MIWKEKSPISMHQIQLQHLLSMKHLNQQLLGCTQVNLTPRAQVNLIQRVICAMTLACTPIGIQNQFHSPVNNFDVSSAPVTREP